MFLSRENYIKLCQYCTKMYICKIYVRTTAPKLPPMTVQNTGHVIQTQARDNNIARHWLECWLHGPDVKLLNSNNNRSTPEFLRLFWDIVVFRLVAYLLYMICLILRILYKYLQIYVLVLYQFLKTGISDRTLIGLNQLLRFSGFSLYPLSFFLYGPFKLNYIQINILLLKVQKKT